MNKLSTVPASAQEQILKF